MCHAEQVFDKLAHCDKRTWNSLITSYVKNGKLWQALALYKRTQKDDTFNVFASSFVALFKACTKLKDLEPGLSIHAEVARKGLLESDVFVSTSLVDMYGKSGSLTKATEAFDDLVVRNVASWTALIAAYAEAGYGEEALYYFEEMQQQDGISVDAITYICGLKACGNIKDLEKGRDMHDGIVTRGLERNLVVGSTLVDMYAKCGLLVEAQDVFDKMKAQDVVSWTALIGGYAEHGLGEEALKCFEGMQYKQVAPDAGTFVCCLKACGSIKASDKGQELHANITRVGLDKDLFVGSALVDMLVKCGSLAEAQIVFYKLPVRNVVLWTALITGYAEQGHVEEALDCYSQMVNEGISPVAATFICGLKGCGSAGIIMKGQKMHSEIVRKGLESELLVSNMLVDMYAKCGSLTEAQGVFDKLRVRTCISWTALITGYAQLGESESVFYTFDRMIHDGIKPNFVTILNILTVCSHAGLLEKGLMCFDHVSHEYGQVLTIEHYNCMVDLLGRAGHIDTAVAITDRMPYHPGIWLWLSVLGACKKWGNVGHARHAFGHAVQLDEKEAAAYVLMFNLYADASLQEDAAKVEALRLERKAWKNASQHSVMGGLLSSNKLQHCPDTV